MSRFLRQATIAIANPLLIDIKHQCSGVKVEVKMYVEVKVMVKVDMKAKVKVNIV